MELLHVTYMLTQVLTPIFHCHSCGSGQLLQNFLVKGDYDLSKTGETRNQMIRVSQKAEHESYNRNTYQNGKL